MNESELRDVLAKKLDVIEPGLTLVGTEVPVKNPDGADGKIDILARDRFGLFVVVELKRSTPASRTALHELLKYLALLQQQKGIPQEKLRCVLVSTHWHELQGPFSELVHTSPFTLSGRQLLLDENGQPTATAPIVVLPKSAGLAFPQTFDWLVFETKQDRDRVASEIERIVSTIGIDNALVLRGSARPEATHLMYPFGIVLPFFRFSDDEKRRVLEQQVFPVPLLEDFVGIDPANDEDSILDDAVATSLRSKLFCLDGVRDVQGVTHDNFAADLETWTIESIFRHGPAVSDVALLPDADIVAALVGHGGGSELHYVASVSTRHKMQWATFRRTAAPLLARFGDWAAVVGAELDRAADVEATVVLSVYSPENLLLHLARYARDFDVGSLPAFDLLVVTDAGPLQLVGFMAWDGHTAAPTGDVVAEALDDVMPLAMVVTDGGVTETIVDLYGFVFPVVRAVSGSRPTSSIKCSHFETWRSTFPDALQSLTDSVGAVLGAMPRPGGSS